MGATTLRRVSWPWLRLPPPINISEMPQAPAQIAQGCGSYVLPIKVHRLRMTFGIIEMPGAFEVFSPGKKFSHLHTRSAKRAMGQTKCGGFILPLLRFNKELPR